MASASLAVSPAARSALADVEAEIARSKKLAARYRTEVEENTERAIFSGEFIVAALATGWAQGRYGEHTVFGFRTDLFVGLGAILVGLWMDEDWGDHLVNLGLGAVAVSGASWAARKGNEHRKALPAGATTPAAPAAAVSPAARSALAEGGHAGARGMRLTDEMLASMGSTIG